eukprot:GHVL01013828.1.p2 GENE.GHVL01013828.1~~GHVL01013828.1.p2  ORF type:complete len:444 (-),score=101.55 GHVL01013828.1:2315-3607(-)
MKEDDMLCISEMAKSETLVRSLEVLTSDISSKKPLRPAFTSFQRRWRELSMGPTLLRRFPAWPLDFKISISTCGPKRRKFTYACFLCSEKFTKNDLVQDHYQVMHRDKAKVIGEFMYLPCSKISCGDIKSHYHCMVCTYFNEDAATVDNHMKSHHGPHLLEAVGLTTENSLDMLWEEVSVEPLKGDIEDLLNAFPSKYPDTSRNNPDTSKNPCNSDSKTVLSVNSCIAEDMKFTSEKITSTYIEYLNKNIQFNRECEDCYSDEFATPPNEEYKTPPPEAGDSLFTDDFCTPPIIGECILKPNAQDRKVAFKREVFVRYFPLDRAYLEKLEHPGSDTNQDKIPDEKIEAPEIHNSSKMTVEYTLRPRPPKPVIQRLLTPKGPSNRRNRQVLESDSSTSHIMEEEERKPTKKVLPGGTGGPPRGGAREIKES